MLTFRDVWRETPSKSKHTSGERLAGHFEQELRNPPPVRHLTSHREIFHLSSNNFGAVSAPGVPAAGAARGGWPARQKVLDLRTTDQLIQKKVSELAILLKRFFLSGSNAEPWRT